MGVEATYALKTAPAPWLKRQVSAAFGTQALLIGDLSEYSSLGKLAVNNLSATKYYVQVFNAAVPPILGAVPKWISTLPANGRCSLDFSALGGLNAQLGLYVGISSTPTTFTPALANNAQAAALFAQALLDVAEAGATMTITLTLTPPTMTGTGSMSSAPTITFTLVPPVLLGL